MITGGNPQPIPNKVKPIAGFVHNNPKNSDAEMLGELLNLTYSSTPQGIQLLLPPIQKAPENNYGESVIQKIHHQTVYHLLTRCLLY